MYTKNTSKTLYTTQIMDQSSLVYTKNTRDIVYTKNSRKPKKHEFAFVSQLGAPGRTGPPASIFNPRTCAVARIATFAGMLMTRFCSQTTPLLQKRQTLGFHVYPIPLEGCKCVLFKNIRGISKFITASIQTRLKPQAKIYIAQLKFRGRRRCGVFFRTSKL